MNNIIYNYIIQAILGGASGYITNEYAINMLFKEYTPLKIGGVIKKTRTEFIDNISSLVENDIINKEKLNNILTDETFKSKFESLTEDFFNNCLYESVNSTLFSNVDSIDDSIKMSGDFLKNILDKNMLEMTSSFFNNIDEKSFFTDKQLEKISSSLFNSIDDFIKNSIATKDIVTSFYNEYKSTKLNVLIDVTEQNLLEVTKNFIHKLNQVILNSFNDKLIDAIKDVSESVEFDEALTAIKEMLYEKSFKDILSVNEELKTNIVQLFLQYIHSANGQHSILELSNSIFSYAKKYDKTLFDLIDSSFEINLKSYLLNNLPSLTENIIEWINMNSKNIDKIIEESVDEIIDETEGMKGKLLSTIKNSYLNNLSEKYNIVQMIIEYVQKETEPEKLSTNISYSLINYLNNVSISQIITSAEDNNILTPAIASKYLTEYLDANFETIFNEFINYFTNLQLKDILPKEFYSANIIKEKALEMILNKILSSKNISNSLCQKICIYFNDLLDKNINELVKEESLNSNISSINDFICDIFNNNSTNIKVLIEKEIKNNLTIKNLQSMNSYSNIPNTISSEILKKYIISMEEIKDKNLSLAVDKINSIDNLYKNSSEMLRSLMINNLDTLLGGSVKGIVTENLNKLSDDELSNLANDFIGRELKPIMYFGGILGTGAGLLLALFQNGPINPSAVNIANMATYSLVGFSTNAIAINMIFRPYKEVKFLSKIPFLRNFSLGYIVKNKKVFAENMAVLIDKNLLSKESVTELFGKYEEGIKSSLTNSIESNNYYILNNLLIKNRESIVTGTYEFTRNLIDNNIETISHFAVNKLDELNLSTLLSPGTISYLSNIAKEEINNSKEKIILFIDDKLNSTTMLETQIPNNIINIMEKYVADLTYKYYDMTNENLSDTNNVKKFMLKYDDKYINTINKPLKEIFKAVEIQAFNHFISNRLYQMVLSDSSRKKLSDTIANLFNKSIGGDKTFEELFDGKLKNYINNNMPSLFDKITLSIKSNITKSKGAIANTVQHEIKNSLGFLEKGMYSLMGGDAIINDLINKILEDKIPIFIDEKEQELLNIFTQILDQKFYKIKVDTLQSSLNKIQINEIVDTYFSNTENAEIVLSKIESIVSLAEMKLEKYNLSDILELLSLQDMNSIFNSYNKEINSLTANLSKNMTENREEIINIIISLINEITDKFIKSTSFKDLTGEISTNDISRIVDNLTMVLNKNDLLEKQIQWAISSYKYFITKNNNDSLTQYIDKNELVNSAEILIKRIINSDEVEKLVKDIYSSSLKEATDLNFDFIDKDTKSYILNVFVESAIESIKRNLDQILKAVEFDRIAREEIDAMEPKKIHEMFNSFADKYFKRLMLYGFGGFIFGINAYIGLLLSSLTIINKKRNIK